MFTKSLQTPVRCTSQGLSNKGIERTQSLVPGAQTLGRIPPSPHMNHLLWDNYEGVRLSKSRGCIPVFGCWDIKAALTWHPQNIHSPMHTMESTSPHRAADQCTVVTHLYSTKSHTCAPEHDAFTASHESATETSPIATNQPEPVLIQGAKFKEILALK